MNTITKFHIRYISASTRTYFVPDWDYAKEAIIIANTAKEAKHNLLSIIGSPPDEREWRVTLDKIVQEPVKYESLIDM